MCGEPKTVNYLEQALNVLSLNFRPNDVDGSMTAASAAYLLRRLVGDFEKFGFLKFRDVLEELERLGQIKTGSNSKDAYSFRILSSSSSQEKNISRALSKRLRSDVWFAFVRTDQNGRCFINRLSGEVLNNCESSPSHDWVEVKVIDPTWEKANATKFLSEHQIFEQEILDSLDDPRWYVTFTQRLSMKKPDYAFEWKRQRSLAIIDAVLEWATENDVSKSLLFETEPLPAPKQIFRRSGRGEEVQSGNLRATLLRVIGKLSDEELMQIRLPAYELVAELRPDLLK